jgi:hypothetical protein
MKTLKEPLRVLVAKEWDKCREKTKSDDLAGVVDFNRGTLQIKTRVDVIADLPDDLREVMGKDANLKKLLAPAGETVPAVQNGRAMWLVMIEVPIGLICKRIIRE